MAVDPINLTQFLTSDGIVGNASNLIKLFQAIGGLIIAYLIFNIWLIWLDRKRVNELVKIIEKKKLVSMVGCNMRFHPAISYIYKVFSNIANKITHFRVFYTKIKLTACV